MIKVNRRRNCCNYRRFGHIIKHCKNQGLVTQERRTEYEDNNNIDNLKKEENLVVLN